MKPRQASKPLGVSGPVSLQYRTSTFCCHSITCPTHPNVIKTPNWLQISYSNIEAVALLKLPVKASGIVIFGSSPKWSKPVRRFVPKNCPTRSSKPRHVSQRRNSFSIHQLLVAGWLWRTRTSSRRPPSSALSLELARSLSIHSSSSGLLKALRASRWMMRSLKGLWVGEAGAPFRRLSAHCFWMSGAVGGAGLLCSLTNLPGTEMQTEEGG